MSNELANEKPEAEKPFVTLPGTVEKVIPPAHPSDSGKAQIAIEGADDLYREIRIENSLQDENGKEVALKQGAEVDVTIEADASDTTPKKPVKPKGSNESKVSQSEAHSGKR